MKKLVIVSSNYPSKISPARGAFVYNIVQKLCNYYDVTVIAPFKISDLFKKPKVKHDNDHALVIRPWYLSVSNRKWFGLDLGKLSLFFGKLAVNKVLRDLPHKPDIIYSHFFLSGLLAEKYVVENQIPLVVASGESSYSDQVVFDTKRFQKFLECVNFVVCVSGTNFDAVRALGFDAKKMKIIPNSVDYELFSPRDNHSCREKLGISPEKFVVGFIGHFIHRKGLNRVIDAIGLLNDPNIVLVAVGEGSVAKDEGFTMFIDPVPNAQLPEIIGAFDIFVLPTLSEGHCNVIEEVKACLVPVVSSKGTSVEKQINESTGILLDPMDVREIAKSIKLLKDDPQKTKSMRKALENELGSNSLSIRALKIKSIIDEVVEKSIGLYN